MERICYDIERKILINIRQELMSEVRYSVDVVLMAHIFANICDKIFATIDFQTRNAINLLGDFKIRI